jgi:rubredoxin
MNKSIPQKILICLLAITLIISFGFLTGFTYADKPLDKDVVNFNDDGTDGDDEEKGYWVCGECGYIYDPEKIDPEGEVETGTEFEDLPDEWVCPECGATKDKFDFKADEDEEEQLQEKKDRIAHLEHVLTMRSKHLEVLQRVIEKMISKDPLHPSIPALQHALQASSKAVLKANESIEIFKDFYNNSNNTDDGDSEENSDDNSPGFINKIDKFIEKNIKDNNSKENKVKDKIKENRGKNK